MTHQPMLDHPLLDAERAANAFQLLGTLAQELSSTLGPANSQYEWFVETASWLQSQADALRSGGSEAVVAGGQVGLRLVVP
jgi:hypothetical protein